MNSDSTRSSLPKNRPHGVETAVLHVISLAHAAMVHARGIIVSSPDARTRRLGDLNGLAEEISLLEEELRIKDARMALIDPHRRPRCDRLSHSSESIEQDPPCLAW